MSEAPVLFSWDGEAMVPANAHWAKKADEQFVVGERYPLVQYQEHSLVSHRHYFATLKDLWLSLPEAIAPQFPDVEHLRKHALIRCGFADKRTIVAASKAEAERLAAFIKPMDSYAIVARDHATVTVWTAQSQSMRAMGKKQFHASKEAVLGWVSNLLELPAHAEQRKAA